MFTKDLAGAADAEFVLVTSQKELDKDVRKINKAIVYAYCYKWPIISKQFVLDADKEKTLPDIMRITNFNLATWTKLLPTHLFM